MRALRPFSLPLFTNVLEGAFSEVRQKTMFRISGVAVIGTI
jgi:hypothetical protein